MIVVNWTANPDVRNGILNAAEDALLHTAQRSGFTLPMPLLDEIGKDLLPIAEAHYREGKVNT
jgi:hypothetical protein